jgi:hypothetical protein
MKLDRRAVDVRVTSKLLEVEFADGRRITAPLSWFPRLQRASPRARARWQLLGRGLGIHWTELDEDLSVAGLLHGTPAPRGTRVSDARRTGGESFARERARVPYRATKRRERGRPRA